jgi:hypothetical protein
MDAVVSPRSGSHFELTWRYDGDVHIGCCKRDGGARARTTHLAYAHLPLSWFLE